MRYCRTMLCLFCLCQLVYPVFGQSAPPKHAGEIRQQLEKLKVLGSVLYLAAHPDDENTRLIGWLANEKLFRTGYLSLTRGDGGQNLIGTEQAEELGLLRTQELLAARRIDGGKQFFSTANDFGFSKTSDEAFTIWDREKVLSDAVWVIRRFRPDVIIARFPPDSRAGHGHHQASAIIAEEAFRAAGDPERFPEQLTSVEPWQAKRLLWNTFNFRSGMNTIDASQFKVETGQFNTLLGLSYGEIAATSRTMHKSQGFGSAPSRGASDEFFETVEGGKPEEDLMEGVDIGWSRLKDGVRIKPMVDRIIAEFDPTKPQASVPALLKLLAKLEGLEDSFWRNEKIGEVQDLILSCAAIWMQAEVAAPKYALGDTVEVRTSILLQNPLAETTVKLIGANGMIKPGEVNVLSSSFIAGEITQPYWLRLPHSLGNFKVVDQQLVGLPESPDLPHVSVELEMGGQRLVKELPVEFIYTDPVRGEVRNPVIVAPPLSLGLPERAVVFAGEDSKEVDVLLKNNAQNFSGTIQVRVPEGWQVSPDMLSVDFDGRDDEMTTRLRVTPPKGASTTGTLSFSIGDEPARSMRAIRYEHVPAITWFPEASLRLAKVETGVSAKRIGYVQGAGDLVPSSLREIGLQVDILSDEEVLSKDLGVYDAIVTGIRLYNVNDRMRYLQPRLLAYVEAGGTLVEQYNVSGGLKFNQLGPYPFELSRGRVTDENSPFRVLQPDSRIVNYPNKITEKDFEGWVQERGLYFVASADEAFEKPLAFQDPGEEMQDGALIVAPYGKGKFVYTSLSFFRELPAGVPGAFRLFVNLLAKKE